jgi:hypothetical protein
MSFARIGAPGYALGLEPTRPPADCQIMRLAAAAALATLALALPAAAGADALLPPPGKAFAGVTGGYDNASFARETGSHPAVFQFFSSFDGSMEYMFEGAESGRSRLAIHISTLRGDRELLTPRDIARGKGDAYLIRLSDRIALSGRPVYIRLMSEMDGYWNPYCAFNANGSSRGAAHSTGWYRRAWRRTVLLVRGGDVAAIDSTLRAQHLPPLDTDRAELAQPEVAFMWVPQVAGAPDTHANAPRAYWPGRRYVDWVGTDFYSKFPNWSGLERFYGQFGGKPFVFAEWAMWGADDPGFVRRLFAWSRSHARVRMLLYNQGKESPGLFRLSHYPRARAELRRQLRKPRFAAVPAEYKR